MNSSIIRVGFVVLGIALLAFAFWTHSIKKMTVNYAVIWDLLGAVLILIGVVPVFSDWTNKLALGTAIAFFCVGVLILFVAVQESLAISQLNMKNRELAMQVALLNQENEAIKAQVEHLLQAQESTHTEEDFIFR